jgi:hypothetical protein
MLFSRAATDAQPGPGISGWAGALFTPDTRGTFTTKAPE